MLGGIRPRREVSLSVFHWYMESPASYNKCGSGVLVLNIGTRVLNGCFGDLIRFGRLGRNRSGYVPPGTNTVDMDEVRRRAAAKLDRHSIYYRRPVIAQRARANKL
jgi:hypothetical protein